MEDAPYTLDTDEAKRRLALLSSPHMNPFKDYLAAVRDSAASHHIPAHHVPDFDPCDGGIQARVLFLLEAPGPKAKLSGFVSSNNPDPTAKNLWNLIHNAGIARTDTLIWNIVPWYVGTGTHILPVKSADIQQALPYLKDLLGLLSRLELIVLVGRKAQRAEKPVHQLTALPICRTYHMSALVFHTSPEKKKQTQEDFRSIAQSLNGGKLL